MLHTSILALALSLLTLLAGCPLKTNEHDASIAADKGRTQIELGLINAKSQETIAGYHHTETMASIEAGKEAARAAAQSAAEIARINDGTKRHNAQLFYASGRFVLGMAAVLAAIFGIAKLAFSYLAEKGGAQLEHETKRIAFDRMCAVLPSLPESAQLAAIDRMTSGLGYTPGSN